MNAKNRARKSSPLYLPSAFDLFKPSKELFMKHFEVFGVLFIVPFILWIHGWIFTPAGSGHWWQRGSDANNSFTYPNNYFDAAIGASVLWILFSLVLGTVIQIMTQDAQLKAAAGKKLTLSDLWQTVKTLWLKMVLTYIAFGLIVVVGFILLIVPGLFMIRRYMFAPYVMLEARGKIGIKEALDKSAELGLQNTRAVWGIIGVSFLISFCGILPIIGSLVSFVLGALYSIAPAIRYQQLKKLA